MASANPEKISPEAQADIDDFLGVPSSSVTKTSTTTTTTTTLKQPLSSHESANYADTARVNPAFTASGDHIDVEKPQLSLNYDADDGYSDDRRPFLQNMSDETTTHAINRMTNRPNSATNPVIPPRTAKPTAAMKLSSPGTHMQSSLDEITPAVASDIDVVGSPASTSAATADDSHQQVHEDEELAKKLQLQLNMAEQTASAVRRTSEESETRDNQIHQDEELAKSLWEEERRAAAAAQQAAAGGPQLLRRRPGSGGSSFDSDVGSAAAGGMIVDPQQLVPQRRIDCTVAQAKLTKSYALLTKMDPYAKIRIGHVVLETDTLPGGALNPRWNKTFTCLVPPGVDSINIEIYDEKKLTSDELIAWGDVRIPEQVFNGETLDDWWPLSGKQGEGKEGMVELVLSSRMVQAYPQLAMRSPAVGSSHHHSSQQQMVVQPQPAQPTMPQWTDEDVKQLHDMFPTVDEEIIKSVMVEKRGNKEEVINVLLSMAT